MASIYTWPTTGKGALMTQADKIATVLRAIAPGKRLATEDVPLINALAKQWELRLAPPVASTLGAPPWTVAARKLIGLREVPGPRHNPTILGFWSKLGAPWLKSDEDPWCGGFMAWSMAEAGVAYPKLYPRAKEWSTWGTACKPQLGAVYVKSRPGGNHVGQLVGITKDGTRYKSLGGNQGNGVSIIDVLVTDVDAIRWPEGVVQRNIPLPIMPAGTIGTSEA
jgi:uncharacterized protein (TIGR02594 family)